MKLKIKFGIATLLLATSLGLLTPAMAGTHTWTGNGANGLWSTKANWENNDSPIADETFVGLIFPATALRRTSTNNITGLEVSAMILDGAAYRFHGVGGGTNMTLLPGGLFGAIAVLGGTSHRFASSIQFTLTATNVFGVTDGSDLSIDGRMVGAGSFQKTGGGMLSLAPQVNHTYSGSAHVRAGELILRGAVGGSRYLTVPAALIIGETNNAINNPRVRLLADHQIGNGASVSIYRNGTLNLNGNTEACGALLLFGGHVETAGNSGSGNLMPGSITAASEGLSPDAGLISGLMTLPAPATNVVTVHGVNATLEVMANIHGGSANVLAHLDKLGAGRLLLSASNSFNGGTFIREGKMGAHHGWALGATNGGTIVATNAVLQLWDARVPAKSLTLEAGATLESTLSESWAGPIHLAGEAFLKVQNNGGAEHSLVLYGKISGPGGFTKTGPGFLKMQGSVANTYLGATIVGEGELQLANGPGLDVPAIPGLLRVGGTTPTSKRVVAQAPRQLASNSVVWVDWHGTLDLQNFHAAATRLVLGGGEVAGNLFSRLTVDGPVLCTNKYTPSSIVSANLQLGGGATNVFVDSGRLVLGGRLSGPAGQKWMKTGSGYLELKGDSDFDGTVSVNAGAVFADGAMPSASFEAWIGGKITGTGQVNVATLNGGWLWLGDKPNALHVAQLLCPTNGIMEFDVANATSFGQVVCTTAPQLGTNVYMFPQILAGYNPPVGQEFMIVRNESTQPVAGTFQNKPEGILFETGIGQDFRLTYQGGDGNDIVLARVASPVPATLQGVTKLQNGGMRVGATGTPGAWYVVEATTDLSSPGYWGILGYVLCPVGGIMTFEDDEEDEDHPQRFYRFGVL